MPRGRFITFEGGEGAGKSTQVRRLAEVLRGRGLDVVTTREPGGSDGAEQIRDLLVTGEPGRWDPVSEALLLYAARRDHWRRLIDPALEKGAWVISDRFADSTIVYQGVGRGVEAGLLNSLHQIALGDVAPDLTLLLDIPAETGLARTREREAAQATAETRFERMDLDFHQRLRRGFTDLATRSGGRIVTIDASDDPDTVADAVTDAVRRAFSEELGT